MLVLIIIMLVLFHVAYMYSSRITLFASCSAAIFDCLDWEICRGRDERKWHGQAVNVSDTTPSQNTDPNHCIPFALVFDN